ncbi:uncharacterized protein F4822DRAFT_445107 [Hypoxylon trugodes]|uniref:uncharacterized protein n=1 Tax=Hypoxylon trugodes TaxID=326681 RepID=UPI002192FD04|nr:uncharacterized protein F4822DRAFT_445107 [Hypoxylon trugodes]KAI1386978.1 hypothetical protein F4822DRAFT_445107 [Hypoxylon trugodes]
MSSNDLSQITNQIPDFIGGLPRSRQTKVPAPPDEFGEYFDYKRFYEGTPAADGDSRSRSDASSIPGLTSGPSEEDGAASPRSTEDPFQFKEAVEKIKQHDDRFTLPAREIRPNGIEPYPWQMEIDNTLASGGAEIQGLGSSSSPQSPASSNGASSSSYQSSTSADSPLSRGKRHRPLDNPEKVAQMRKVGACFRCKARKVPCGEGVACSRCVTDAGKYCSDDGELAEHMCFRKPSPSSDLAFHIIWKEKTNQPTASQRGSKSMWNVYFTSADPPLVLPVSRDEQAWCGLQYNQGQDIHQYVLNPIGVPDFDATLIKWASWQMLKVEERSFQSALDILVSTYAREEQYQLPHYALVRKVHDLRCMYKIWRQKEFFCHRFQGPHLEPLPERICQDLKGIIVHRMKTLESDIWAQFYKLLEAGLKPIDRLPLWACMMQLVLMYRDIYILNGSKGPYGESLQLQIMTTSLFENLVVMCEIAFGKKKPEAMTDDGNPGKRQLNADFEKVNGRRDEFYKSIENCVTYTHSSSLDRLFCVLLIGTQKGATKNGARAPKRAKR